MHGRVAPAFVEEATVLVERLKVVDVGLGPKPVQAPNLEIRPLGCLLVKELGAKDQKYTGKKNRGSRT